MKKLVMELIGAFFLVLVIALTGDPLAIGVILMVMVYMWGHISGAHYNPAATLGIWIRGKISTNDAWQYVIAQIVGAFLAVGVAYILNGQGFIPAPGAEATMGQAFLAEVLFTFALVSVILHTATEKKTAGNDYFGLAIWFTVMAGAFAVGGISGGAFNPAVGLGPWLFDIFNGGWFEHVWLLYVLAPLLGGAVAGYMFKWIHPKE